MSLMIRTLFVFLILISVGCKSSKHYPEITLSQKLFSIDNGDWHMELPVSPVYQGGVYSYDTASNSVILFNGHSKIILIDISKKKIVCEYALDQNFLYFNAHIKKILGNYFFKSDNKIFILISPTGKGIINITDSVAKHETNYFDLRNSYFDIDTSPKIDNSIEINVFYRGNKNVVSSFILYDPIYQKIDTIKFSFETYTKVYPPY